jgi:hypothetical protein
MNIKQLIFGAIAVVLILLGGFIADRMEQPALLGMGIFAFVGVALWAYVKYFQPKE